MTDRIDAVPEADFVEQSVPAYPDILDEDAEPELPADAGERDATEADVIEQAIPVPLEDDYTDEAADY
ncbi:hypothetical protein [Nocardia terpenica]|uniref:Uncharacterized protein n=1 Tax=Nocardia terpenica TaxID=455432 RepID=A0A164JWF9_9NOCA|nr:hypothetical protein [Nocardia terpenica]ATL70909.1 hypothetical protein CRH09_36725 [Nocardia terpenica]KZM70790.1 hypothetical protein AWN90_40245 [Nocardia terpenica]MBF6060183.1 hypothetical protein [Nocardia terpenica]MBF6103443.1 hypothetical protein [Nocardia terpenica]MBF6112183.1 hypothetical protein [Nocardia terpenica]